MIRIVQRNITILYPSEIDRKVENKNKNSKSTAGKKSDFIAPKIDIFNNKL